MNMCGVAAGPVAPPGSESLNSAFVLPQSVLALL